MVTIKVKLHTGPGELNVKVVGKVEEEKEVRAGNQPRGRVHIYHWKILPGLSLMGIAIVLIPQNLV